MLEKTKRMEIMNNENTPYPGVTDRYHDRNPQSGDNMQLEIPENEKKIEASIQALGLNAPRISPTHINEQIVGELFYVFPGTTMTVCCLALRNGFNVIGESAAASPENFNEEIGRRIAKDNARNKIWALEGYLLRSKLTEAKNPNKYDKYDSDAMTQSQFAGVTRQHA